MIKQFVQRWLGQMRIDTDYVRDYVFPPSVVKALRDDYPQLSNTDLEKVLAGLRQFFLVCAANKLRWCTMPSKVVDAAWHAFILDTRAYAEFCTNAFGVFLHHTPAVAMHNQTQGRLGIKRAWDQACVLEGLEPTVGNKIPLLFLLDHALKTSNGYYYVPNCEMPAYHKVPNYYCAGHLTVNSHTGSCGAGSCGGGCGC